MAYWTQIVCRMSSGILAVIPAAVNMAATRSRVSSRPPPTRPSRILGKMAHTRVSSTNVPPAWASPNRYLSRGRMRSISAVPCQFWVSSR
jgi:hypothetical protein